MKKNLLFTLSLAFTLNVFSQSFVFDTLSHGVDPGSFYFPKVFTSVFFLDENNGWVSSGTANGQNIVIKTTNGGDTWNTVVIDATTERYYNDIQFVDTNTGFAISSSGYVFRTTDGGENWEQSPYVWPDWINSGLEDYSMKCKLHFFDANTGFVARNDKSVMKITDFSNVEGWTKTSSPGFNNGDMDFLNENVGWIVRESVNGMSNAFYTTDGGLTWIEVNIGDNKDLKGVSIVDENTIFVTSNMSDVFKTTDGGSSWTEMGIEGSEWIYDIDILSSGFGFAVGQGAVIYAFQNNGATISKAQVKGTTETLYKTFVVNENLAFAVGGMASLLRWKGTGGTLVKDINPILITIYPNPASNYININLSKYDNKVTAELYSINGKLCKSQRQGKNLSIKTSDLAKGTYILKVKNSNGKFLGSEKVIIN
ncbi:MAG: T9SS type A sorting domain-containing protein [Chlorobi bacterium]|nr:T9SS type A sorting domain-containing protein [Chlorobiota bacterium]